MHILNEFLENECGATAIEYGLIAGLIAMAVITGAQAIGTELKLIFTAVSIGFKGAPVQ
jgi:pilus assembly protein Flp/PilA